ncbi:hypothetical protein LEMA_P054010.1 [Plenodomus lingam JN3]|uniref:Uncharacterized protein n=1 Tax=Leptosphaeria maculans (strain JN3 / isolate v23.1.3 / race Av1-4-5-6-7-8) TaxID=985895 RepID=E4ZLL5_LEPMJ|nr:hypothetical protein LEMA_P054010.1 [Plenodomus lingam JN3]CBX92695.1 hypothetical protein LEMA_P054010.1 [Plenodomus lingam JN3]
MAAVSAPRRTPSYGPRSPTLSDAGMILPVVFEVDSTRPESPAPYMERPPSPPALYPQTHSSHVKLTSAPQCRRRASPQTKSSPSLSAQSSRSTLRTMTDSGASHQPAMIRNGAFASSPTVENALGSHPPNGDWQGHDRRRLSTASSSVLSADLDNWPGFDSQFDKPDGYDDSGIDLVEKRDHSSPETDMMGDERWLHEHNSGSDDDDDPYSSAALSRRAEIILANAKKRLNVCVTSDPADRGPMDHDTNKGRSWKHVSATRERDRRLYSGMGPIPPRIHSYRSSQLAANSITTHSRGLSETSVPLPFKSSFMSRSLSNKRASSAIGHTSGPWAQEGYKQGRFPIKESRSHEVLRDPRSTWTTTAEREPVVRSHSRTSRSPSALETLPEDEDGARLHRSASAASGLRDQVNDLKGRISSLKLKAQEDHLRRCSLQNLRASSPFTAAKTWQSGVYSQSLGPSPFTADAGLGIKTDFPARTTSYANDNYSRPRTATTTSSQREGEELVNYEVKEQYEPTNSHVYSEQYTQDHARSSHRSEDFEDNVVADETDEDFMSAAEEEDEEEEADAVPGGDSVYEDAVYELQPTERHEDRVDAFDYEHFFLHSAMGTYSVQGRRSSTSSGSSNATTRPVTALQTAEDVSGHEKRSSLHGRNPSVSSISTVASFATAAEEQDDDDANEQMDQFSQQLLSTQTPFAMRPEAQSGLGTLRTDSAINMRRGMGSSPTLTSVSRGSSTPTELAHGLQTSKIFSILTERSRDEPRLALSEEETQLIYGLAASMTSVCASLQNTHGEAYDRKAWRRRLDEARRVLNGEEIGDDQSF